MTDFERHSTDDTLLLALAKGATVRAAAEQAGLSEATAFRRLRDAEFVAQMNRIRGELWNSALGRLTEASGKAVDRLVMLVDDGDSDAVKLSACKTLLELGTKLRFLLPESCGWGASCGRSRKRSFRAGVPMRSMGTSETREKLIGSSHVILARLTQCLGDQLRRDVERHVFQLSDHFTNTTQQAFRLRLKQHGQ